MTLFANTLSKASSTAFSLSVHEICTLEIKAAPWVFKVYQVGSMVIIYVILKTTLQVQNLECVATLRVDLPLRD